MSGVGKKIPKMSNSDEMSNPDDMDELEETGIESSSSMSKPNKRKRSVVWDEFDVVTGSDKTGVIGAKCSHCKNMLAYKRGGATSHLNRHLKVCVHRRVAESGNKKGPEQALLSFEVTGRSRQTLLSTYQYDKDKVRELLAKMFIVHEYPFRMVEYQLFVLFYQNLNPRFQPIKRHTLRTDCIKLFAVEKEKLKGVLASVDRISLTSDLWTSNQTLGYMCLTCHYLDAEWNLQKRILNFCCLPPPHTGIAIADCILQCLSDWDIEDKVSTITLDNASSNDSAVRILKDHFAEKGNLYFNSKIFHVRCCAHVLNLMVQDGLSEIRDVIENIRESVKYMKMSPSRLDKFNEIVKQLKLSTSKHLILDVPTRWNSTHAMLESALQFKAVFPRFKERDSNYKWLPTEDDWTRAAEVSKFLEVFKEATKAFSGSKYSTSNLFLRQIWKVKLKMNENSSDTRDFMKKMTTKMNEKFAKYWGECNLLMAIGAVLDPRYKMQLIKFCFPHIYYAEECDSHINEVSESLHALYSVYASIEGQTSANTSNVNSDIDVSKGKRKRDAFDVWAENHSDVIPENKTELDIYLKEGICKPSDENYDEFDALNWWKVNAMKF